MKLSFCFLESFGSELDPFSSFVSPGGTCMPIDPKCPRIRVEEMLEVAHARLVITDRSVVEKLPSNKYRPVLVDTEWDSIKQGSISNLPRQCSPDNLAYVLFTSGTRMLYPRVCSATL